MKIWGDIPKVTGIYGNTSKIGRYTKTGEVSSKKDELSISGKAKDFSIAMQAVRQIRMSGRIRLMRLNKRWIAVNIQLRHQRLQKRY